jgi:hypothetical protein
MSDVHDVTDLVTAQALITTLRQEIARSQQENATLRAQLDALCRRLYGKSSERVSPDQLRLAFTQLANEPGPATDPVEMDSGERPGPEKRRRARRSLRPARTEQCRCPQRFMDS